MESVVENMLLSAVSMLVKVRAFVAGAGISRMHASRSHTGPMTSWEETSRGMKSGIGLRNQDRNSIHGPKTLRWVGGLIIKSERQALGSTM